MSFHDSEHATAPGAELDLLTDWQVVSFVDPAGTGSDLAFTQGLSAFDLPELLLWARPTEGLDPGADWLLTHRERSRLLNCWALEMINGGLQPGTEREERFDGGHSVARFRFGPPTLVSPLQYPYLPPTARVICTAWSLLREAAQPPAVLGTAASRRMERWIAAAEAVTRGWRLRSGTLNGPEMRYSTGPFNRTEPFNRAGPDTRAGSILWPDQVGSLSLGPHDGDRFGPMTRWVDARIAQVLAADAEAVAAFLERLQLAGHARCEDCLLEQLTRFATRSHRNSASREASRVAQELGLTLTGPPGQATSLWLRALASAIPEPVAPTEPTLRTILSDGLEILLVSAVLADVAPPSAMASAAGPWEWAVNDHRPPGHLWLARPAIRRAACELLAPATPALVARAVEHALQSAQFPARQAVSRLVTGLQTTAGASARPGALLRRDQGRGLPRSIVRTADQLAGQLLTAMALPYRFPEDSWDLLRQSLRPLVPALPVDLRVEIP